MKDAYTANKQVCFGGDNYSEEWHAEAEQRGLKNLRTTPDALPEVLADTTVAAFEKYERALRARARVALRGVGRAVRDPGQHRGGDHRCDRAHDAAAGGAAPPRPDRRGRAWPGCRRGRAALVDEFVAGDRGARERPTATRTASRGWSWRCTPATTSWPRWRRCARWRTGSRSSWPTTSGRCRSTGDPVHQVGGGTGRRAGSRRLPRRAQLALLAYPAVVSAGARGAILASCAPGSATAAVTSGSSEHARQLVLDVRALEGRTRATRSTRACR